VWVVGWSPSRQQSFTDVGKGGGQLPKMPWVFERGDKVVVLFPCPKSPGLADNLADKVRKPPGCCLAHGQPQMTSPGC